MSKEAIEDCITKSLEGLFLNANEDLPLNLYDMLIKVVELPMLKTVMRKADYNQSKAARWLGITRVTLQKKLELYKLQNLKKQDKANSLKLAQIAKNNYEKNLALSKEAEKGEFIDDFEDCGLDFGSSKNPSKNSSKNFPTPSLGP